MLVVTLVDVDVIEVVVVDVSEVVVDVLVVAVNVVDVRVVDVRVVEVWVAVVVDVVVGISPHSFIKSLTNLVCSAEESKTNGLSRFCAS